MRDSKLDQLNTGHRSLINLFRSSARCARISSPGLVWAARSDSSPHSTVAAATTASRRALAPGLTRLQAAQRTQVLLHEIGRSLPVARRADDQVRDAAGEVEEVRPRLAHARTPASPRRRWPRPDRWQGRRRAACWRSARLRVRSPPASIVPIRFFFTFRSAMLLRRGASAVWRRPRAGS
jgi:hypothetical protein